MQAPDEHDLRLDWVVTSFRPGSGLLDVQPEQSYPGGPFTAKLPPAYTQHRSVFQRASMVAPCDPFDYSDDDDDDYDEDDEDDEDGLGTGTAALPDTSTVNAPPTDQGHTTNAHQHNAHTAPQADPSRPALIVWSRRACGDISQHGQAPPPSGAPHQGTHTPRAPPDLLHRVRVLTPDGEYHHLFVDDDVPDLNKHQCDYVFDHNDGFYHRRERWAWEVLPERPLAREISPILMPTLRIWNLMIDVVAVLLALLVLWWLWKGVGLLWRFLGLAGRAVGIW